MGRGQQTETSLQVSVARSADGASFGAPALDRLHPISDLWEVSGKLGSPREEARCLAHYLSLQPVGIDGRPGNASIPRHSQMRPYRRERVAVLAVAMNRRFIVEADGRSELGTVGDYLVQERDGSARAVCREEFRRRYQPLEGASVPDALQVPLADARQSLLEGDLDEAFATLRSLGVAAKRNLQARDLSQSLLEASREKAQSSLARQVSEWFDERTAAAAA